MPKTNKSVEERFWEKVDIKEADDCWEWKAYSSFGKYGQFGIGKKLKQAHYVAWELTYGPIPKGFGIQHHCGNSSCTNPKHLFLKKKPETMEERFWEKVDIKSVDDCWMWQAGGLLENGYGYGKFNIDKVIYNAHVVAWKITNGSIPDGLYVLHTCDKPGCCNPNHLFLGTQKDNWMDCYRKNRANHVFGSRCGSAKITEQDVVKIRVFYKTGNYSQNKLGEMFNLSGRSICAVVRKEQWKHVE
jgi:hypothetical protein